MGVVSGRPLLSVSIVSFNTRELLRGCLRAVLDDTRGVPAEIIVVDNASRDGSPLMIEREFPETRLIPNGENRLFSEAQNQAIAASAGRFVLMLNPDTAIRRGTLGPMLAYMDAHPRVGAMSGALFFPDGRRQLTCARFTTHQRLLLEYTPLGTVCRRRRRHRLARDRYDDWDRTTERDVDVLPGSFILARREILQSVGAFDPRLRLYFSDDDWCRRVQGAGYRLVYAPFGGATHVEGASSRQVPALARRLYFEDMRRYVEKYSGGGWARALWCLTRPMYWGLCLWAAVRTRGHVVDEAST